MDPLQSSNPNQSPQNSDLSNNPQSNLNQDSNTTQQVTPSNWDNPINPETPNANDNFARPLSETNSNWDTPEMNQSTTPFNQAGAETPSSFGNVQPSGQYVPPQQPITQFPNQEATPLTQEPFQGNSPLQDTSHPRPKRKKRIVMGVIALLLVTFLGSLAFGTLVAFGKIDLGNNDLETRIARFIFSLPFIEPTPEFVLAATSLAHESVTSLRFDSSFAIEIEGIEDSSLLSSGIPNALTSNSFDLSSFEVKTQGSLDYTDLENPKSEISINVENAFSADFRAVNEKLFFKVNKVPTMISTAAAGFGFDIDPFLNSWISYPINDLDTEATDIIKIHKDQEIDTTEYDRFIEVMKSEVLPKVELTNGSDTVENTHKLHVTLTDSEFKDISRKLSGENGLDTYLDSKSDTTMIETFEVNVWVNKKSFLIQRMEVYTNIKDAPSIDPASNVLGTTFGLTQKSNPSIRMAATITFSQYGESFDLTEPEPSETIEEFVKRLSESVTSQPSLFSGINPELQTTNARDAKRKSTVTQLSAAVVQFQVETKTLPSETNLWIQQLVTAGMLSSVPNEVEYTETPPCSNAAANGWCYDLSSPQKDAIIYTRLENNAECPIELPTAWYVYSSIQGRSGTVCTAQLEPVAGAQEFVR